MQSLKVIPKVIAKIQDLQKYNHLSPEEMLAQYKRNFKTFVETFTQQVAQLIQAYQLRIDQLTKQNQKLRQTISFTEPISPIKQLPSSNKKTLPNNAIQFREIDMMQTAKSNVFASNYMNSNFENGPAFSAALLKYSKLKEPNQFPIQLINQYPGDSQQVFQTKSRFMTRSNIKKQKESQLMNYLEAGSKNLQKTTRMFMSVVGKDKEESQKDNNNFFKQQRSESTKSIRLDISNNKSLSNICESLETSYHSRKARSRNMRKKQLQQEESKRKQKQDQEVAKMLKDRGIKNLLHRLRDNVENSTNQPQIIKNSKLISCGKGTTFNSRENAQSPTLSQRRNSKVMINPVPIDLGQKSRATRNQSSSSPISPERKPHSILKNSNVLTRSLSGISAIDFV